MKKILFVFSILFIASDLMAADYMPKRFNTITSHSDVYPYVLNNTKQTTKKTSSINNNTSATMMGKRKVVKRQTNARAATAISNYSSAPIQNSERRVVQRTNAARAAKNVHSNSGASIVPNNTRTQRASVTTQNRSNSARTTVVSTGSSSERMSSQHCMANYKECMEMYCLREDTAYNRCYCSARLAQIDAKYQNKIDELIQKIVRLQYSASVDSDEIKEYWDKNVASLTGSNPWVNIDNALNIEWADTQSRVRGQNAFNTGHQYCVQHLRACSYMATNLRDSYKSEIARDCDSYEKGLQKIQEAAESVIESYND